MSRREANDTLIRAVQQRNTKKMNRALQGGANVNYMNRDGLTPLGIACSQGFTEGVAIFIQNGVDITFGFSKGCTALHIAAGNSRVEVVRLLLDHGARIDLKDIDRVTPFGLAIEQWNVDIIKLMLEFDPDCNQFLVDGSTPLCQAVCRQDLEMGERFLKKGAKVNAKDKREATPLFVAVERGDVGMVKWLISRGADVSIRFPEGPSSHVSLFEIARQKGHVEIEKILREYARDVNYPIHEEIPSEERTALVKLLSRPQFKSIRRPAWLPVAKEVKASRWFFRRRHVINPTASRYGGIPWLVMGEAWPLCQDCERPMHFFVQINLQETPADAQIQHGGGLVQFFYCRRRDCRPEGAECDRKGHLIRYVENTGAGRQANAKEGPADPFPTFQIVEWSRQIDGVSHLGDIERFGIELTDEEHDLLAEWGPLEVGDKMGGWPAWIQEPEEHRCTVCGKEMRLLFQFNPDLRLKYSFGQEFLDRQVDLGCAWFFQCLDHRDQMEFTWQCH